MESSPGESFRDSTRFWVQCVLVPIVVTVGVLGNFITVYLLNKRQPQLSSNVYLTALATSDTIYLIGSLYQSLKHYLVFKSVQFYWAYLPFGLWITDAASSTSVWLTVSYTCERCMAVCNPMSVQRTLTKQRAKTLVIAVYITCFILTASTPWEWKVVTRSQSQVNSSDIKTYSLKNTDLGQNPWYRFLFHWFSAIAFVFLPLAILTVGNHELINAVRASRQRRQDLIDGQQLYYRQQNQMMCQENRLSITLIAIVSVFIVCQMPTAIVVLYTSVRIPERASTEENVLLVLGNICNLLVAVNAACNFILYTATSDRYRNDFVNLFGLAPVLRRWKRRISGPTIVVNPVEITVAAGNDGSEQADDTAEDEDDDTRFATSELYLDSNLKDAVVLSNFTSYQEGGRTQRFSVDSWASTAV